MNDNRRNHKAENRILAEIQQGLKKDLLDVEANIQGHQIGIKAAEYWYRLINNKESNLDSLQQYYYILTRSFISIQNTSGCENLKSRGLKLIENDSLRTQIISLYEYDYKTLSKLEENYAELQFHEKYFKEINYIIAPHMEFNEKGNITGMAIPLNLTAENRKIILSYLWQMRLNRRFILQFYDEVDDRIKKLSKGISHELND